MAVNAGPLTTFFTPPPACTSVITSGDSPLYPDHSSLFVGHWMGYSPASAACYPSSSAHFDFSTGSYYWSPGVCPHGYSTACSYTEGLLQEGTTAALCCPRDFKCHSSLGHVCVSLAAATLSNVFAITGDDQILPPTETGLLTVTPTTPATVFADGIPVAWASTDTEILQMFTQSTGTTSTQSTVSQASSSLTTSSSSFSYTGTPKWTGSGPLLTGRCATPEWTLVDITTAYFWAQVQGCAADRQDCCPFSIPTPTRSPLYKSTKVTTTSTSRTLSQTENVFDATPVPRCPNDYVSSQSGTRGCCPQSFTPTLSLGGTPACASPLETISSPPPIPGSIFRTAIPPEGSPTTKPISTVVDVVYALRFAVSPEPTLAPAPLPVAADGLSLGTKIGIGLGVGVGAIVVIAGLTACGWRVWKRKTEDRDRHRGEEHVVGGSSSDDGKIQNRIAAAPGLHEAGHGTRPQVSRQEMSATPVPVAHEQQLAPRNAPVVRDFAVPQRSVTIGDAPYIVSPEFPPAFSPPRHELPGRSSFRHELSDG